MPYESGQGDRQRRSAGTADVIRLKDSDGPQQQAPQRSHPLNRGRLSRSIRSADKSLEGNPKTPAEDEGQTKRADQPRATSSMYQYMIITTEVRVPLALGQLLG